MTIITNLSTVKAFRLVVSKRVQSTSSNLNRLCRSTKLTDADTTISSTAAAADHKENRVCIVGGGFGGLYTALKLNKLMNDARINNKSTYRNLDITLIDSKDKFVFLPLLYELAVGSASISEVAPLYTELVKNTNIKFIQSSVDRIDTSNNEIQLSNGNDKIKYDKIVLAVGAQPRVDMITGAKENALPFYRIEDAYNLQLKLRALISSEKEKINVSVIGGGYSGVEVATNIAEYIGMKRGNVCIIDRNDRVMHTSPAHNQKTAEKSLKNLSIVTKCNVGVKEVTESGVIVSDRKSSSEDSSSNHSDASYEIPADLVVLTCGVEPSKLIQGIDSKDINKDQYGRLVTNRSLQSINNKNIFVLGDCGCIENEKLPSTAQVAMQQSDVIAANIFTTAYSSVASLEYFKFVNLGEMLTLGDTDASVSSLGNLIQLDGPLAAVSRRLIYAYRMPTNTQKVTALVTAALFSTAKLLATNINKNSK